MMLHRERPTGPGTRRPGCDILRAGKTQYLHALHALARALPACSLDSTAAAAPPPEDAPPSTSAGAGGSLDHSVDHALRDALCKPKHRDSGGCSASVLLVDTPDSGIAS